MHKLNREKKQITIENTMPYFPHKERTVTPTKATTTLSTTTKSSMSARVRFKAEDDADSGDNNSDDDFVTPTKPRQKTSAPKSSPEPKNPRTKVLSAKMRGMLMEIKELTYQVEEGRTEMHLYKDKINDMQTIAHVALIQGEEIRNYSEERMIRGDFKENPRHPPVITARDSPEVPAIMRSVIKHRNDLNKLIRKYTEA